MKNKEYYISLIRERYEQKLNLCKDIREIVADVTTELQGFEGKVVNRRIGTHLSKSTDYYVYYYKTWERATWSTLSIKTKDAIRIQIELNLETPSMENRFSMEFFQEKNPSYFTGLNREIQTYERLLSDKDDVECLAERVANLMTALKEVSVHIYSMPDTYFLMEKFGLKGVNFVSLRYD